MKLDDNIESRHSHTKSFTMRIPLSIFGKFRGN